MLIIKLLKNHEKGLHRTYHYFYPRQSNQTTNLNNKNPIIFDRKIAKKIMRKIYIESITKPNYLIYF